MESRPEIDVEQFSEYAEALEKCPLVRTMAVLAAAVKQPGAVQCSVRVVAREPLTFAFDLLVYMLDPTTGDCKLVKVGTLQPLEPLAERDLGEAQDDAQSFAVPAPATLN